MEISFGKLQYLALELVSLNPPRPALSCLEIAPSSQLTFEERGIGHSAGRQSLFSPDGAAEYDAVMSGIGQDQLRLVGHDLIYGRLFDRIGFGAVRTSDDEIFKSLVVTRLYRPGSKLRTPRYMAYFMNMYYDEDRIYRYLDELCHRPGAVRKAGVWS